MPATRPYVDRDVKSAEILDAAEERLLRDGYEATTMAAIAADVGVANNAVYWYFSGKDELLAAVLSRRLDRALAQLQELVPGKIEPRVLALLAQLDRVAMLTAAVHERARHSAAVAEQHAAFHATAERYLIDGFKDAGLTGQDPKLAASAIMAMVEGVHLHERHRDSTERDRLIVWTVRRLVSNSSKRSAAGKD